MGEDGEKIHDLENDVGLVLTRDQLARLLVLERILARFLYRPRPFGDNQVFDANTVIYGAEWVIYGPRYPPLREDERGFRESEVPFEDAEWNAEYQRQQETVQMPAVEESS